jgi:hypothetical protein
MAMFFRMMGQAMAKQSEEGGKGSDLDLILALFSRDRAHRLKVVMAEQFEDLGGTMTALDGPEGSTIITERNKVALDVLKKQIADGKTKIGIFYGAGHLPDMEKRLVEELQLKATDPQWIDAWNLRKTDMQRRDGNRRKDLPKK